MTGRTLRRLAALMLVVAATLAVGSTGQDIRGASTASAHTVLVPGQSYSIVVPAGDHPQCRDVSDDGFRTPLSDWGPCPHATRWYPADSFTATYLREYRGGHLFATLFKEHPRDTGERAVYDRFIAGPAAAG